MVIHPNSVDIKQRDLENHPLTLKYRLQQIDMSFEAVD